VAIIMAGAGGIDAIQTMVTPSIDYSLWHVDDGFLKAKNDPIRGTFRPTMPTAKDMDVRLPEHPANTGDANGMYGISTRVLSDAQQKMPPEAAINKRPANEGSLNYILDPKGCDHLPYMQSGNWKPALGTGDPPALARNWEWSHERAVGTTVSQTAYTYDALKPGAKKPTWTLHFGLNATRPTFGKMKSPLSAHPCTATLAHEMAMDKEVFSPFRTTVQKSLSTPPVRAVPVWGGDTWELNTPLLSHTSGGRGSVSRNSSRGSRKLQTASGVPNSKEPNYCLPHNLLGCMLCSMTKTSKSPGLEVYSLENVGGSDSTDAPQPPLSQQSTVSSMLSGIDFGRVASPLLEDKRKDNFILARSCKNLDGVGRSLVVLPEKWGPLKHLIKDEMTARALMNGKVKRGVLSEAPKHIMQHLHAQMRSHPDSSWQPNCFPVVQ
jgi:hypothetical protein